jgi:hypothetical protein
MTTMNIMSQKSKIKLDNQDSFEEENAIPNQSEMDEIYDIKF